MAEEKKTQADEPVMADMSQDDASQGSDAVEATVAETVAEPVVEPEMDAAAPPAREVIFVDAPARPRKRGNRGLSVLLAIPATLIYVALLIATRGAATGINNLDFLREPTFYFPAIFLFIGIILLGLVLNRSAWWTHIVGSVVVGAIVWFGSASLALVSAGMLSMNQSEATQFFYLELLSGTSIIAALLAREVAIWTGAVLARRGRTLKVRNTEAHAAYEKEQADLLNTGR